MGTGNALEQFRIASDRPHLDRASFIMLLAAITVGCVLPNQLADYLRISFPGSLQSWLLVASGACTFLAGGIAWPRWTAWGFLAAFAATSLSCLLSSWDGNLGALRAIALGMLFAGLIAHHGSRPDRLPQLCLLIGCLGACAGLLAFLQAWSGRNLILEGLVGDYQGKYGLGQRIGFGFTYSPLAAGIWALVAISAAVIWCRRVEKAWLWGGALAGPSILLAVLTASRGIWVGLAVLSLCLFLCRRWRPGLLVICLTCLAFALQIAMLPKNLQDDRWWKLDFAHPLAAGGAPRLASMLDKFTGDQSWSQDVSGDGNGIGLGAEEGDRASYLPLESPRTRSLASAVNSRRWAWTIAWDLFHQRPLLGHGPGAFEMASRTMFANDARFAPRPLKTEWTEIPAEVVDSIAVTIERSPHGGDSMWDLEGIHRSVSEIHSDDALSRRSVAAVLVSSQLHLARARIGGTSPHSTYLSWLAELGLVGAALWPTALFLLIRPALLNALCGRQRFHLETSSATALVGALAALALVWHLETKREFWMGIGLAGAVAWSLPGRASSTLLSK